MEASELLDVSRSEISARRAFGEPVQLGDAIIIPAAKVRMGAGGGGGKGPSEQPIGAGSGFGLSAKPVGAFVIRQGHVRWRPAIDVNRIILGGQLVVAFGLLVLGTVLRAQRRLRVYPIPGWRRRRLLSRLRSA
jgi:hypothetical protein